MDIGTDHSDCTCDDLPTVSWPCFYFALTAALGSGDVTDVFDPARFVTLGRVTSLALSLDGSRLVAVRQKPDAKGAKYVSALW